MGIECGVFLHEGGYWVAVDADHAETVLEEWRLYEEEQIEASRPRQVPESEAFALRIELALLWVLALLVVFYAQGRNPVLSDRFCNSTHALMIDGEWWRPFTALFLHADWLHLLGNALIGGVFCVLAGHAIGALRGWLLILACGTLANAVNAAIRMPDEFLSLGASTATFAALGLLVGHATRYAWMIRSFQGLRMLFVPLIAGGILLGWFGGGGADAGQVDVAGHVFGWVFGVAAGFFLGKPRLVQPGATVG
jgi:membrane associated rhomboid family serine protease